MNFQSPKNSNYAATVVQLSMFVPLEKGDGKQKCDNVKAAIIYGMSVIVGKDTPVGAIGLYFPAETTLSKEFLGANNLYRKPEFGNVNPEAKGGYFEEHGRIKTMKFRGHKSEGFWIPIESLTYLGIPLNEFVVGATFDTIQDREICRKYVPKMNPAAKESSPNKKGKKVSVKDAIIPGHFVFHYDTAQLRRNAHRIQPDAVISISEKWHGTSGVFSHGLVKRKLTWFERFLTKFGVNIKDAEYGHIWASRRVVKGVDGVAKDDAVHFYGSDIWGTVAKNISHLIPKGFTVYGEIVGYTPDGSAIQSMNSKVYHYGCPEKSHRLLIYRVTSTNFDGKVTELTWGQMKGFCAHYGLEIVPELYYGRADGFLPHTYDTDEEWQTAFVAKLEELYVHDQMCHHNDFAVPAEGIVVRVDRYTECEGYKLKAFAFLNGESAELDNGTVDIETSQSESVDEE